MFVNCKKKVPTKCRSFLCTKKLLFCFYPTALNIYPYASGLGKFHHYSSPLRGDSCLLYLRYAKNHVLRRKLYIRLYQIRCFTRLNLRIYSELALFHRLLHHRWPKRNMRVCMGEIEFET